MADLSRMLVFNARNLVRIAGYDVQADVSSLSFRQSREVLKPVHPSQLVAYLFGVLLGRPRGTIFGCYLL